MYSGQWVTYKGDQYYLASDGTMAKSSYVKSNNPKVSVYYWVNDDGIYEPHWDTETPDLQKYKVVM